MLFSLDATEIRRLRQLRFRPEFTNAEMLLAVYRTDPEVVARILPKPLKPAQEPLAVAFVARYPQTNFGCVYNEGALFVSALYRGKLGGYCLSMPVDDDTAMIGGREKHGFPKKMAERIELEHAGTQVIGRVVRKGTEILRIELEPSAPADISNLSRLGPEQLDDGRACLAVSSYLFKFFPRSGGTGFDFLPRLVRQTTLFRPRPGLRQGSARVIVKSSPVDPLGEIPVIGAPVLAVHGNFDNSMLPGKVVARVWNPWRFLPHAFFKTDATVALLASSERYQRLEPSPRQATTTPASARA